MRRRILVLALILNATFTVPAANAQQSSKTNLTVEWIFSDEGRRVASLPSNAWLADGKLMLYDGRRPPAQRAFEILDPATGARRIALDMSAAVASLNALLPAAEAKEVLAWPQTFDRVGGRALFNQRRSLPAGHGDGAFLTSH